MMPPGITWSNVILHLCADEIIILNLILWRFDGILLDLTTTATFNYCQNMGLDFVNLIKLIRYF